MIIAAETSADFDHDGVPETLVLTGNHAIIQTGGGQAAVAERDVDVVESDGVVADDPQPGPGAVQELGDRARPFYETSVVRDQSRRLPYAFSVCRWS